MSDTPRTDVASWREHQQSVVDADFSRELERELAAMREQRDEAQELLCRLIALRRKERGWECNPETVAAERGWDCFKEGGNA